MSSGANWSGMSSGPSMFGGQPATQTAAVNSLGASNSFTSATAGNSKPDLSAFDDLLPMKSKSPVSMNAMAPGGVQPMQVCVVMRIFFLLNSRHWQGKTSKKISTQKRPTTSIPVHHQFKTSLNWFKTSSKPIENQFETSLKLVQNQFKAYFTKCLFTAAGLC